MFRTGIGRGTANSNQQMRYRPLPTADEDFLQDDPQEVVKTTVARIWSLPYRAIVAVVPLALLVCALFLPVYTSCKHNFRIMDTHEMDNPSDTRCTATPAPPLIPIFITVATLDMSSALLFTLGSFRYGRRFSELVRSIMGLVFFMVVHTYARENTILSAVNGQNSSVGASSYIILFSGLFLQAIEASGVVFNVNVA